MNAIIEKPTTTPSPELAVFNFGELQVRVVMKDREPWFVAKDACKALRLSNTGNAYARLDDYEKGYIRRVDVGMVAGRSVTIVAESGLYKLIMRSDKPEAKRFQNWVTQEVLPSIRKTGAYSVPDIQRLHDEPSFNAPSQPSETEPLKPSYPEHRSATQMFGMMGQLVDKLVHEKVTDVFEASLKESDMAFEELTAEYKGHVQELKQEMKELWKHIGKGYVVGKLVHAEKKKPASHSCNRSEFLTVGDYLSRYQDDAVVHYADRIRFEIGTQAVDICDDEGLDIMRVLRGKNRQNAYPKPALDKAYERLGTSENAQKPASL